MSEENASPPTPELMRNVLASNPRFVRQLKGELMEQARSMPPGQFVPRAQSGPSRTTNRPRWDRSLLLQFSAVVILMVALIGSIASGYRGNGRQGGFIPAPLEEPEHIATYREDAARTGVSRETGPLVAPGVVWNQGFPGQFIVRSIYANQSLYLIASEDSTTYRTVLEARDAENGSLRWQTEIERTAQPWLLVADDTIYVSGSAFVGDKTGSISAYDASSGRLFWTNTSLDPVSASPVLSDMTIYLSTTDRVFHAIDARSGSNLWQADIGILGAEVNRGTPIPVPIPESRAGFATAISNGLAFVSADDGVLYAIDLQSHELAWHLKTDANDLATPAASNGFVYLTGCYLQVTNNGRGLSLDPCYLYQINENSGKVANQIEVHTEVAVNAALEDFLVVSIGGQVKLLSSSTLGVLASFPEELHDPIVTKDMIYLSDGRGTISAFRYSPDDTQPVLTWSAYLGAGGDETALIGGGMLFKPVTALSIDGGTTLFAIGTTPDATPATDATSVDLSGLAACKFPESVDWENLSGTPAKTITNRTGMLTANGATSVDPPTAEEKRAGYSSAMEPWIDFDAVPEGAPVPDEVKAAILATTGDILACLNRQSDGDYSGFFSTDFLRRDYVRFVLGELDYPTSWFAGGLFPNFVLESADFRMLEDGRVAVLADPPAPWVDNFAMFVVFVKQDGRWVVDEVVRVGSGALQG